MPLLGLLISAGLAMTTTPVYSSSTQMFVATQGSGNVAELQVANTFSQDRVQSYVQTVNTPAVLQPVINELSIDASPEELSSRITASTARNTVLIEISATDSSPVRAAAIAQATAESLIDVVGGLETPDIGGTSPVKMTIVTPAAAPLAAASPNVNKYLALGLAVGLATGVGIAFLRNLLDTRIGNELELREVTSSPLLGGIVFDESVTEKPLLTQVQPQSPRAEAFRQIRTNLQFTNIGRNSPTVLVTSSLPGEGKSTTATNLAIAMAEAGKSVVLVEADLRRPMISKYLGVESSAGLTSVLTGAASLDEMLQPWGDHGLYVLASGQLPPNPSELLGSEAMTQLIQHLEDVFDAVIIDAPPLIPVTDAAVLAQKVGRVVLVVGARKVHKRDLEKSIQSLNQVQADLVGMVLNFVPTKGPDAYSYHQYGYDSGEQGADSHNRSSSKDMSGSHVAGPRRQRTKRPTSRISTGKRL